MKYQVTVEKGNKRLRWYTSAEDLLAAQDETAKQVKALLGLTVAKLDRIDLFQVDKETERSVPDEHPGQTHVPGTEPAGPADPAKARPLLITAPEVLGKAKAAAKPRKPRKAAKQPAPRNRESGD